MADPRFDAIRAANPGMQISDEEAAQAYLQALKSSQPAAPAQPEQTSLLSQGARAFNQGFGNVVGAGAYGLDQLARPVQAPGILSEESRFPSLQAAQTKAQGMLPNTAGGVAGFLGSML